MPIYMQFPNANGSVTAQGYQNWIELSSLSFGMDRPSDSRIGTAGYSATGKLQVHNITIQKPADGASPALVIAALQGTFNNTIQIAFVTTSQSGLSTFMNIELDNAGISSAHLNGGQQGLPVESYAISFAKIIFTFSNLNQAGQASPTIHGYDLELAQSI